MADHPLCSRDRGTVGRRRYAPLDARRQVGGRLLGMRRRGAEGAGEGPYADLDALFEDLAVVYREEIEAGIAP